MAARQSSLPTVPRVLLIDLDGVTCDVLGPLAASGTMPNVANLLESSALAELRLNAPPNDLAAWATIESGGGPRVHGLLEDRNLDHRRRCYVFAGSTPLPCPTLGDLVAQADPQIPKTPVVLAKCDPKTWSSRPAAFADLSRAVAQTEQSLRCATASALETARTGDWRLMVVRFKVFDRLLHRASHALGIGPGPGASRQWVAKTREAFCTLDRCLGSLLAMAERHGAAVVLVSTFGFAPFRERIAVSELLRRSGLLHWVKGWARVGHSVSRFAWRMAGKVSAGPASWRLEGLQGVEMRRTRALSLYGASAAMVFLNTPERFGARGPSATRDHEQTVAELLHAFQNARHPATAAPLFQDVYLTAERFQGDPLARGWPEMVAVPAPGFCTRLRLGGRLLRPDATLTGARNGDGFLLVHASQVALGRSSVANAADIAPTVLALMGISPPGTMTGRVLRHLFQPEPTAAVVGGNGERAT